MLFLLVGVLSLALFSCLTIEQNITVNRDGSGVKTLTMDMGALFDNPMMQAAMESSEEVGDLRQRDSSFLLIDDMRSSNPQWTAEDIALLERGVGRLQMDMDEQVMVMTFTMPFSNFDELAYMEKLMSEAKRPDEGNPGEGQGDADMLGMMSAFGGGLAGDTKGTTYEFKKGRLVVTTPATEGDPSDLLGMGEDAEEGMDEMLKSMMEEMMMITTYTMPGKVTKVSGLKDAITDGNTVYQEVPFETLLSDTEAYMSGQVVTIKYKK